YPQKGKKRRIVAIEEYAPIVAD
ncbi:MAG: hypothetical protein RL243_802, partial [Actinomycetota bacterium]